MHFNLCSGLLWMWMVDKCRYKDHQPFSKTTEKHQRTTKLKQLTISLFISSHILFFFTPPAPQRPLLILLSSFTLIFALCPKDFIYEKWWGQPLCNGKEHAREEIKKSDGGKQRYENGFFIFGHNAILCGYFRNYIRYFSSKTCVIEKATPPFRSEKLLFHQFKNAIF